MDFLGIAILVALAVFVPPIAALARASALNRRLTALEREVAALRLASARGAAVPSLASEPRAAPPEPEAEVPQPKPAAKAEPALPLEPAPAPAPAAAPEAAPEPPLAAAEPAAPAPVFVATPAVARASFEQRLTERWAVWLGALALALGGIFLVRYSIEAGLLGPEARVLLGFLLGIGLAVAGEGLRERWRHRVRFAALAEGAVPIAISAAGVAIAFASVYAAYALYDLIPSLLAFAVLAVIALGAVLLSLLQGQFIALLGLVGAYAVPLLVGESGSPALGMFVYLLFVTAACFAVVRHRQWWWLAWAGHAGYAGITLLWIAEAWTAIEGPILGPCALVYAVLVAWIATTPRFNPSVRVAPRVPLGPLRVGATPISLTPFELALWGGAAAAALLFTAVVRMDGYSAITMVPFFLFCALALAGARVEQMFSHVPWAAAVALVFLIGTWHEPSVLDPVHAQMTHAFQFVPGPRVFLGTATVFGALFGVGAFVAMAGSMVPAGWATLSATVPLAIAVVGYARLGSSAPDLPWSLVALALAGLALGAAAQVAKLRDDPRYEAALAAYAVGVAAAVAFAMTIALSLAWLSVGLALLVAAIAEVYRRIRLAALRHLAAVVAGVVLSRLLLNEAVLEYELGTWPILNGLLYAYGIPAIAFWYAAAVFRAVALDRDATLIEGGAIALTLALGTLQIHHFMNEGRLTADPREFTEPALLVDLWLLAAIALVAAHRMTGRWIHIAAAQVVAGVATIALVVVVLLAQNPFFTRVAVGELLLLDWLLVAYLVPAVLIGAAALRSAGQIPLGARRAAGLLALLLGLTWATLEVRHAFRGPVIVFNIFSSQPFRDVEWYAYSAAWLVYGAVLLAAGIRLGIAVLRWASLAVIALAVAKVFLLDMAALTGLWRALSFLGLGGSLIALGWAYQRFVFARGPA